MDEFESPQDVLQSYFDELFTDSEGVIAPAQPVDKPEPKARPKPRLVRKSAPKRLVKRAFAEPDIQAQHKVKLEKLLQTASITTKTEPVKVAVAPSEAPKVEAAIKELHRPENPRPSSSIPKVHTKPKVAESIVDTVVADAKTETAERLTERAEVDVLEQQLVEPEVDLVPETVIEGLEWAANGRPQWAQAAFDVLLFKVSGLTLAVPLVSLGQIQPITDELTPIFGQAEWFMGLLPTALGNLKTVNTALFVMPERYDPRFLETAKLVISINGLPWGLAVDSVNQPITLDPEAVNWRSNRSKRAWLAGTVKEQMCALIDIPRMGKLLQESDANT